MLAQSHLFIYFLTGCQVTKTKKNSRPLRSVLFGCTKFSTFFKKQCHMCFCAFEAAKGRHVYFVTVVCVCVCVHVFVKCHHGFPPISAWDRWAEWMWQRLQSRDVGWESLSSPATITFCVPYLTLHPSQKHLQLQRQLRFLHSISVLQHLFIRSWLYTAPSFCETNECIEYKPLKNLKA